MRHKYPIIVLDCDGVILDSNHIKTAALREVVAPYGAEKAEHFVDYHRSNGGISRYIKFEYFLRSIIGQYSDLAYQKLLTEFSENIKTKLLDAPLTKGADQLITQKVYERRLFIVSGGDQQELQEVFAQRELSQHFQLILGSPTTKDEHCKRILEIVGEQKKIVFLGDSRLDYEAARDNGFDFIFISDYTDYGDWHAYCKQQEIKHVPNIETLLLQGI